MTIGSCAAAASGRLEAADPKIAEDEDDDGTDGGDDDLLE